MNEPSTLRSAALAKLYALAPILGLLGACSGEPPAAAPLPVVYVSEVRHLSAAQRHTFSGVVAPRVEGDLAFRVGGELLERRVSVGDQVKRGQTLARLNPDDRRLGEQAAAQQVQAAQVDAAQSASDAARFARLLGDGSVGAADTERQRARADAAAARLSQAQAQWALARNRLHQTTLVAPYDGVITATRVEPGQVVAEGTPVIGIARARELDVVVDIPEQLAADPSRWQAGARLSAQPREPLVDLTLREQAPLASPATRTVRLRYGAADTTRAPTGWMLGRSLEVHLQQRHAGSKNAVLPISAVVSTHGQPGVWLVNPDDGTLRRQAVVPLAQDTQTVQVQGLQEGALVVSVGAHKLDEGMRVRPVLRAPVEERSVTAGARR